MLDELKNLDYHGGKDGLLFFICDVIGRNEITIRDARIICAHAPQKRNLTVEDLIRYCLAFGWITKEEDIISLSSSIAECVSDYDLLNKELIRSTVEQLFKYEIFDSSLFSYDAIQDGYSFKNELLPLAYSAIRNVLISQGFLIVKRFEQGTKFYVAAEYDSVVAIQCNRKRKLLSLNQLKKQLEDNELAGEKAELFVLSFEKDRIGSPLCDGVKRISEIDVSAGYDIVSFCSCNSKEPDRFIEVKAVSNSGFFWSKNEFDIARLKGEMYYLYLVELSRVSEPGYTPEIIRDPASNIMRSDDWFAEAQSYHIKHV